jgi:hypothetical protein
MTDATIRRGSEKKTMMSWLNDLVAPECPLCGKKGSRPVHGLVDYGTVASQLKDEEKWLRAHGITGAIPNPPDTSENRQFLNAVLNPPVVENGQRDGGAHYRCKNCKTLLPPQFAANVSATRDFAIAVAGNVGHGKTSWLLAILSSPDVDRFEIVRHSEALTTRCYEYAEPYTIDVLKRGFRSLLYYQLFGTTLAFRGEVTSVRTVDIKGEMFDSAVLQKPDDVITRHLTSTDGEGWLLVLDQFAGAAPSQSAKTARTIAAAYESIYNRMQSEKKASRLRRAVVWTFLDHANWDGRAGDWLRRHLPAFASELIAIGETAKQPVDPLYGFVDLVDGDAIFKLQEQVAKATDLSDGVTIDGLVALLFRLQLLYTLRASNYAGSSGLLDKFRFLFDEGRGIAFVEACQTIAKNLYRRRSGSALANMASSADWTIFPCGRFEDCSVWADQILIGIIRDSTNR